MRRRIALLFTILLMFIITLSACGSYPDLTDEENAMVEEYAAALLLKYDSENHSRLVDTEDYLNQYNAAVALREESIKQYEEAQATQDAFEEEQRNEPNFTQTESSEPIIENDGTGGAAIVGEPKITMEEFLDLQGFTIAYAGNLVCKNYPEDSAVPISASSGRDLLVVMFAVSSNAGGELDLFHKNASYKVSVNGGSYITNNMTILDNDLSQYLGNIPAGAATNLALIFEVKEGTKVTSLNLSVSTPEKGSIQTTLVQ